MGVGIVGGPWHEEGVKWLLPATVGVLALGCGAREPEFRPPVVAGATRAQASETSGASAKEGGAAPESIDQVGLATWYGRKLAGRKTANGERFDPRAMTAAHRKLPFGTWVEVRRIDTGRVVRVRINDRGPWHDRATIIDLSERAAEQLDLIGAGRGRVELRVVTGP